MLALAEPQERAIGHRSGPLLLIGEAGTGKTEVLAQRFEQLSAAGTAPERILVLASSRATAQRLCERVEQLLDRSLEELWIDTWEQLCERLLREYSTAANLDPFFSVLGPAERLALLLDRLDELPLRDQQIRGNPAGLLARLLAQIDEVKAGSNPPDPELAELIAAHDRILADTCSLDRGDVYLTLSKLFAERSEVRRTPARPRGRSWQPLPSTTRTTSTRWSARARTQAGSAISTPRAMSSGSSTNSAILPCAFGAAPTSERKRKR
jgi:DNA helicase-2/ATP-dependent DNA helicase PcrA